MAVSPYTAWGSAAARAATSRTSPGSLRRATHAQRLASVGTLVRVLEPPVKEGVNMGLPLRILLTVGALIEPSYDQRNTEAWFSALRDGASRLNWVS